MKKSTLSLIIGTALLSHSAFAQGPQVDAITAEVTEFSPTLTFIAKMEAQEHTHLTPRVSGQILEQHFADGATVQKGDVLFQIDPVPYQQALAIAKANKLKADAALDRVKLVFDRVSALQGSGGAAQSNLDDATAEYTVAQASVAQANAALEKAQDDLSYTKIRAPYAGQLGKATVSMGDMVSPATGALIDIVMVDPIKATFSIDQTTFNKERSNHQDSDVNFTIEGMDKTGTLSFIDNKINPSSGTILLSATFDNLDKQLMPNQLVRVQLSDTTPMTGTWIPQAAVQQDLHEQFVFIAVNGQAERRAVEVIERNGKNVFVSEGIDNGDQIITNGLLRVRAGAPVTVSEL